MQQLNPHAHNRFALWRRKGSTVGGQTARSELRLGIIGAAILVVLLVASGIYYVMPIGKSTYTAELIDAGSIRPGDDVRIAGIPVGKVASVKLDRDDHVRMRFTVRHGIFVGDQSTLDIKMLTLVGGHYVALRSAGDSPLSHKVIPADHVRLPYNLAQVFQDAVTPIREVDGDTLRRNFAALQTAMTNGPDGLRQAGNALDSLADILVRQNADVSRALDFADEYLTAINNSKSLIGQLIAKLNLLQTIVIDKKAEVGEAVRITNEALSRLAALGPAWNGTLKPMARKLADSIPELEQLGRRIGDTVTNVHDLLTRLQPLISSGGKISIDQSSALVNATDICVPVAGKDC